MARRAPPPLAAAPRRSSSAAAPRVAAALLLLAARPQGGAAAASEAGNTHKPPTRQFHAVPRGSDGCGGSEQAVPEEECLEAVEQLRPPGKAPEHRGLVVGDWDESVPPGCSMHTGGDWAALYNHGWGRNDGSYSPVCLGPGKQAGECRLHREEALTEDRFASEYLNAQRPVVAVGAAEPWLLQAKGAKGWGREAFVERFGELPAPLRDPERLPERGGQAPLIGDPEPLSVFAASMARGEEPIPLFESNWHEPLVRAVRAALDPRDLPVGRLRAVPILSLGGQGTGVSFHRHPQNWLAQLHGRKRWFLLPPNASRPSFRYDPCSVQEFPPPGMPLQSCDVSPGDILYLPDGWWHATCNLDDWTLSAGAHRDVGAFPAPHLAALDGDAPALRRVAAAAAEEEGGAAAVLSAAAGEEGETPAHVAALVGNASTLALLDELGASLTAEAPRISSPLLVAAQWGHVEVLDWFGERLQGGLRPAGVGRSAPLHRAARWGHAAVVRWLLERSDVDVLARDGRNRTALHMASLEGHAEVAALLLEAGGEARDARDRRGLTPLDLAIQRGEAEVARVLGADFLPGQERPLGREEVLEDEEAVELETDAWWDELHTKAEAEPAAGGSARAEL